MATRKERIDELLTRLVTQLEAAAVRPGGMTAAEAGVLITLHRHTVGGDDSGADVQTWTEEEKRVVHDLARAAAEEDK